MSHTATHIAELAYNAALRRFEAVVEFFSPAMPAPLRVPVTLAAAQSLPFPLLSLALTREARRRALPDQR